MFEAAEVRMRRLCLILWGAGTDPLTVSVDFVLLLHLRMYNVNDMVRYGGVGAGSGLYTVKPHRPLKNTSRRICRGHDIEIRGTARPAESEPT